jgi:hypothetical protein
MWKQTNNILVTQINQFLTPTHPPTSKKIKIKLNKKYYWDLIYFFMQDKSFRPLS